MQCVSQSEILIVLYHCGASNFTGQSAGIRLPRSISSIVRASSRSHISLFPTKKALDMVDGPILREHIRMVWNRQSFGAGWQNIHVLFLLIFHLQNSSVFGVCGTAARRSQGNRLWPIAILFKWHAPSCWRDSRRRKRKEPHDDKKSSHTDYTETSTGFLRSCGIRKTSLRQRLHSTAALFDCFQYIRNRRSNQDSQWKKCSCPRKIYESLWVRFERTARTASVCTLAKKGASSHQPEYSKFSCDI